MKKTNFKFSHLFIMILFQSLFACYTTYSATQNDLKEIFSEEFSDGLNVKLNNEFALASFDDGESANDGNDIINSLNAAAACVDGEVEYLSLLNEKVYLISKRARNFYYIYLARLNQVKGFDKKKLLIAIELADTNKLPENKFVDHFANKLVTRFNPDGVPEADLYSKTVAYGLMYRDLISKSSNLAFIAANLNLATAKFLLKRNNLRRLLENKNLPQNAQTPQASDTDLSPEKELYFAQYKNYSNVVLTLKGYQSAIWQSAKDLKPFANCNNYLK